MRKWVLIGQTYRCPRKPISRTCPGHRPHGAAYPQGRRSTSHSLSLRLWYRRSSTPRMSSSSRKPASTLPGSSSYWHTRLCCRATPSRSASGRHPWSSRGSPAERTRSFRSGGTKSAGSSARTPVCSCTPASHSWRRFRTGRTRCSRHTDPWEHS